MESPRKLDHLEVNGRSVRRVVGGDEPRLRRDREHDDGWSSDGCGGESADVVCPRTPRRRRCGRTNAPSRARASGRRPPRRRGDERADAPEGVRTSFLARAPRRRRCATERTNDCASSASGPLTEEGGVDRPPLAGGRLRRRALLLLRVVVATRGRSDAPPRAPRGHLLLPLCRRRSSSAGARGRRPEAVGDAGQGRRRGRRRRRRRPRGTNAPPHPVEWRRVCVWRSQRMVPSRRTPRHRSYALPRRTPLIL